MKIILASKSPRRHELMNLGRFEYEILVSDEEEKIDGQKFYVDANLYSDVKTPGLSDELDETVNYAKACKFINKFMT